MYKIDRSLVIDAKPAPKVIPTIVKKEEIAPKIDVKRIREVAEAHANEIVKKAQQNAAEVEKTAFEKGYGEGYRAGEQKAEIDFQAMSEEGQNIIEESRMERKKLIQEAEQAVVNLALDIAKKIVLREIDRDNTFVLMVKKALDKLATASKATLFVNPEDGQINFPDGVGEIVTNSGVVTFTVEPNSSLPKGNCTVETEDGTVKAGVDEQIEKIRAQILPMAVGDK